MIREKCAELAGNELTLGIGVKKLGYGSILYILRIIDCKRKKNSQVEYLQKRSNLTRFQLS